MAEKGLGMGLGALFGNAAAESAINSDYMLLPIAKVEPRANQPRRIFDEVAIAELADSIREHGIIQPLIVRRLSSGYYQIVAGERRWRAARVAGLLDVPVRIISADDRQAMELALIENLQREDLNPIEVAEGYRSLIEEYGLTQEEAAARVGHSRPAVTNALRLLSLPDEVRVYLEDGRLTSGHARAVLQVKTAANQLIAAEQIVQGGLSVRQAEALAKRLNSVKNVNRDPRVGVISINYLEAVESRLTTRLGRKVKIHAGKKRGRFEIEYYGSDDLEAFIEALEALGGQAQGSSG